MNVGAPQKGGSVERSFDDWLSMQTADGEQGRVLSPDVDILEGLS